MTEQKSPAPAPATTEQPAETDSATPVATSDKTLPEEIGGPRGPEPTRYGDWEQNGICRDF